MNADKGIDAGDENYCPGSADGHKPDWNTVTTESDGGEWYIDVRCVHCNRSGCVGTAKDLLNNMSW